MKKFLLLFLLFPFLGFGQLQPDNYVISNSNSDANFKTLAAAVSHVNSVGVAGAVTFLLDENQTVTSQIVINQLKGSSAANTLTIKPNVGKSIVVNANMQYNYMGVPSVFFFNGASNVIIDGSNSSLNTKDLTLINNDNINYDNRSIIWIASNGNIGSTNITVKNSFLKFTYRNDNLNLLTGVYSGNNSMNTGNNYIDVQPNTAPNSNITIANNEMINVKDGINVNGNTAANLSPSGWKIQGNKIGSSIIAEKPVRGIYINNALNYEVSGNTISGVRNTQSQGNDTAAIVALGTSSGIIYDNYINDIANTQYNNGEYYTAGIFLKSNGETTIYNNIISNIYITTGDLPNENFYKKAHGIIVTTGTKTNIYFNTIVMSGEPSPTAYASSLYIIGGSGINIKNNIFVNSQSNKQYAVFKNGGTIASISNNDYYVSNATNTFANRNNAQEYIGTSGFTSWNTTLSDTKSISVLPQFLTARPLHLENVASNNALQGVMIEGITKDIDEEQRLKPYIGADEIACALPKAAGVISGAAAVCAGTASATYTVPAILNATSYIWTYSGAGVTFTNGTTNNPTITFAANATSGKLTVKGKNSCGEGLFSALDVVVNPAPTPTFTTAPQNQTCGDLHIWYETQAGKYDYVWDISGIKNTDYKIIDKGTSESHQIVIEWLTAGPKTVKVNYSNTTGGCKAPAPATYSTTVLITDQGRVKGGGDFCAGAPLPLLTLYRLNGNNVPYSDPLLVLKWQYSDDLYNQNWTDIPETEGKATYTPTVFPGPFRTYRAFLQNGPCSKTAIETRITIIPVNTPSVGAVTQPTCLSSVSGAVLNELPASGTIIQTGTVGATYPITGGGTQTIEGLVPGTYHFAVSTGSCTSIASADVVINPVTNIWNGSAWSNEGKLPSLDQAIVFDGDFTSTEDLEGCSCTVNAGKKVVFKSVGESSGPTLKITNKIEVLGTGTLTMENDTNLLQVNDNVVNTGKITVNRTVTPRRNKDNSYSAKEYSFYASPVKDQNMKAIFGGAVANSAYAMVLNEPKNNFINANAAQYGIAGKGFAVKDPTVKYMTQIGNPKTIPAVFNGIPNNGVVKVPVTKTGAMGWNLVGNPYPSNLDLQAFYSANSSTMDSTIRFWDKSVNATYVQYGSSYNGYSYALYNAKSDMGNAAPGGDSGNNQGIPGPSSGKGGEYRYAKVGQGFVIRSLNPTDSIKFKNGLRTTGNKSGFFGKRVSEEDRDIYRIQLVTSGDLTLTQSFAYFSEGSNSFGLEDTRHPAASSSDAFYSFAEESKLIINGRTLFNAQDQIPLGYRNFAGGICTIRAVDLSGVFAAGQAIYLRDKDLGIYTNLTAGDYSFASASGEFTNRFEIVYKPAAVLGTGSNVKYDIQVYRDQLDFVVKSSVQRIVNLEIYDMSGRLLLTQKNNNKEVRFSAEGLISGAYIVKALMEDGQVFTKKIRK